MKYYILLLFTFLVASYNLKAQTVMMEEKVSLSDSSKSRSGPNEKKFMHLYLGMGTIFGSAEDSSAKILAGRSNEFIVGFRFKRKISNFYALGFDVNYNYKNYSRVIPIMTYFPIVASPYSKVKRRITSKNIQALLFQRFNFGRRGNYIGNFLDIGVYAEFALQTNTIFIGKANEASQTGHIKKVEKNVSWQNANLYNWGANIRVGMNRYVLFCNYRMSSMFKSSGYIVKPSELPRITAGLQIGLHG